MLAFIENSGIPLWPFTFLGLAGFSYSALSFIYRFIRNVSTRVFHVDDFRKFGSWAVVTGASDGIGQAYAEELAKKGMNIVLISRSEEKLSNAAKEISEKAPQVEVQWITADFGDTGIYGTIEEKLNGLDIGVLINNVGMACDSVDYFWETKRHFTEKIMNVNLVSAVLMTHIVMPKMAEKNRGLIINVASIAGSVPPYLGVMYCTTKAFMKRFSFGLQLECAKVCPGVVVQDLSPFFVATKLAHLQGKSTPFLVPSPDDYVGASLKTVGLESTNGHIGHELQGLVYHSMPSWLQRQLMYFLMHRFRKEAIRARENAKKQG